MEKIVKLLYDYKFKGINIMASVKHHYNLIKMFQWAIMQAFNNNPDDPICLNELKQDVEKAWFELQKEGKVVMEK